MINQVLKKVSTSVELLPSLRNKPSRISSKHFNNLPTLWLQITLIIECDYNLASKSITHRHRDPKRTRLGQPDWEITRQ